jgi:hypothetical protein
MFGAMISDAVQDMASQQSAYRIRQERLFVHVIDRLLFELEECNLIGLREPPRELRVRCLSVLRSFLSRRELARARADDVPSLLDRLFAVQHHLMRRQRAPEFAELPNDFD